MGGTLLIVRKGNVDWEPHISPGHSFSKSPSLSQSFCGFQSATKTELGSMSDVLSALDLLNWRVLGYPRSTKERWLAEIEICMAVISRISSIDGAVILDSSLSMIQVGAKVLTNPPGLESVSICAPNGPEPEKLAHLVVTSTDKLGGTRHRSAANFVNGYPNGAAIVASQDGRLTLFLKDAETVVGFRLEDLV